MTRGDDHIAKKRGTTKLTQSGIENRELSAHGLPTLPRSCRSLSFPYCKQVPHLKHGEYHKLEKCCHGKGIEQWFCHHPKRKWTLFVSVSIGRYPYHYYTRLPLQNSQLEKWPGPTASSSLFKPSLLWLWLLGPYPVNCNYNVFPVKPQFTAYPSKGSCLWTGIQFRT
jgi:hypothetical protein